MFLILTGEARIIGAQIELRAIGEPSSRSLLTAEYLHLRQGEALFFNNVMHLHRYVKESWGSLKSVLVAFKKMKPALFMVVEQNANHNGPSFLQGFASPCITILLCLTHLMLVCQGLVCRD